MDVINEIIKQQGSQAALARALGVNVMTVGQWKARKNIPADWVLPIEKTTGIPCWEIRPDLYPPERFKRAA